MKYCIQYYKDFRYNDIIDEVVINYATYRDSIVDELQKQNWKDNQRIIIDIQLGGEESIIPILKMCMKNHTNFAVRLDVKQKEIEEELRKAEIPFFYSNFANTPDEVYGMIQRGVSDVYVVESLAFNLKNISLYCKEEKVNVRLIPNVAQYKKGFKEDIPDPYKFFIRPEDVDLYEPYADVFEIMAKDDILSVTYEIYRNKRWEGDLQQLIGGLEDHFYNNGIIEYFGEERLKCNQRCMQEKCTLCKQMKELADKFEENKLKIETPREKEWKNETKSYKEAVRIVETSASSNDGEISEE